MPQGLLSLLKIFISELEEPVNRMYGNSARNTKLANVRESREDQVLVQRGKQRG